MTELYSLFFFFAGLGPCPSSPQPTLDSEMREIAAYSVQRGGHGWKIPH